MQDLSNRDISLLWYLFEALSSMPKDSYHFINSSRNLLIKRGESRNSQIINILKLLKKEIPNSPKLNDLKNAVEKLKKEGSPAFIRASRILNSQIKGK